MNETINTEYSSPCDNSQSRSNSFAGKPVLMHPNIYKYTAAATAQFKMHPFPFLPQREQIGF